MSSFIQSVQHFQIIAQGIKQAQNNTYNHVSPFYWHGLPWDITETINREGLEKFINRLAALNVKSVNHQYNDDAEIFEVPVLSMKEISFIQWFKAIQSLSYQIEYPESDQEIYSMLQSLENTVARRYIMLQPEYDKCEWTY